METPEEWLVIADACAACKPQPTWGPFISSYRIHWASTDGAPLFEGAQLCTRTGVNRAELLAIIYGLQALVIGMEAEEYSHAPVNVLTDSQVAFDLATHRWTAQTLRSMVDELDQLCDRLAYLADEEVAFIKVGEKTVRAADSLGRAFKTACDPIHRAAWDRAQKEAKTKRRRRS